jgi:hypothetical protein
MKVEVAVQFVIWDMHKLKPLCSWFESNVKTVEPVVRVGCDTHLFL